ncbi:hypothetical protein V5O48_014606, partial [Marasmius crinis-equi]
PVLEQQHFFVPRPTFFGSPAPWNRRKTLVAALSKSCAPDTNIFPHETNSALLDSITSSSHLDGPLFDPEDPDLSIPPDLGPDTLPMDVWNPYYKYSWSYPQESNVPTPSAPSPTASNSAAVSTTATTMADSSHWLSRSELLGRSILVDIVDGLFKKKGAYVEPTQSGGGLLSLLALAKGKEIAATMFRSITL